jgi:hypothetical protein
MEKKFTQTFTLTFGDQGENHKGMQKIGKMAKSGFSLADLLVSKRFFEDRGVQVEIYHLNKLLDGVDDASRPSPKDAYVLVARGGANGLLDYGNTADELYEEQNELEKDSKALMYGRVVDKKARHNLCFSEEAQEPDYENGKGRIVSYEEVPIMSNLRDNLAGAFPPGKTEGMIVEGNYYYDVAKCYIGFHGDAERRRVIGVRLGASFKFHYQWFGVPEYDEEATKKAKAKNSKARDRYTKKMIGSRLEITLDHGDLYIMSEKAVGTDWMSKRDVTLRHAAGDAKCPGLKGINKEWVDGECCAMSFTTPKSRAIVYERDKDGFVVVEFVE